MSMVPIKVLLLLAACIGLVVTVMRVRAKKMHSYSLIAWGILWFFLGSLALVPELASQVAVFLGVGRGADAIIYVAIVIIFFILFRVMIRIERIEQNITTLVSMHALSNVKKADVQNATENK